jgi:predicted ATPase
MAMSVIDSTPERAAAIRTPDQRLRVFVSSTLGELAPERAAAREAIQRLRLAPVMFEMGARPHPPRALYRAYLEQSHVFVGIYWQSYGWVSPDMEISGIEDEYELASGLPCLVYVKEPAPQREPRLEELLDCVRAEDRVSYKPFQTAEQLADLIADDVALLLTEHFETPAGSDPRVLGASALRLRPLPVAPTRLVGRARDLDAIGALVSHGDTRLVTLSGMGGIGKTRLALAAADALSKEFPDGVGFADLSSVQSPELVPTAVASAVGVPQEGTRPVGELVLERLSGARMLLVLDNFEHVTAAATFVAQLLASCPGIKVIVTSRALLRLRGEHEYAVQPLELPRVGAEQPTGGATTNGVLDAAAVQLFVERAREHQPRFTMEANAEAVVELCSRLEGIPLAIELAAARIRVLPPRALLGRIEDRLDLLSGPSDLPARQRTLRTTIDWSYELLDEQEREAFAQLSVFVGGFGLESAQVVCDGDGTVDVLEVLSSLIEKSLVVAQERPDLEPRFRMLETVRQYAHEQLAQSGAADATKLRMAEHFADLAEQARDGLIGVEHSDWISRLDAEADNLRVAMVWAMDNGEPELFLRMAAGPWIYWWQRGYMPQYLPLSERCLASYPSLPPESRALQLFVAASERSAAGHEEAVLPLLRELIELAEKLGDEHMLALARWEYCSHSQSDSVADLRALMTDATSTLRRLGDQWVSSFALGTLGILTMLEGEPETAERLGQEALGYARAIRSESATGVALSQLGYVALGRADVVHARERFADSARAYQRIQDHEGLTYAHEGLAAVAFAQGQPERAARAIGVVEATRKRLGVSVYGIVQRVFRTQFVSAVEATLGPERYEAARAAGADDDPDEAIEELLRLTAGTEVHT